MAGTKADLILHPVRFRILQTLTGAELTTQEIADRITDVPKSSIYRYLKQLLDGGMVEIAQARLVHGIQEKRYRLAQRPYLAPNDLANVSADEHLRYFTAYVMSLLHGFDAYLQKAEAAGGIDFVADYTGYTEAVFYASPAELDTLQVDLNAAVMKLAKNGPGDGRRLHKLAVIGHPGGSD